MNKKCRVETTSQQTQNICINFVQRRPNVFHVGPTLYKCYTNGLCLLGLSFIHIFFFTFLLFNCLFLDIGDIDRTWSNNIMSVKLFLVF